MRAILSHPWFHLVLLLLWFAVGLALRFWHLPSKPLWTDEFTTIVFSLGNSFRTIPLDTVITAQQLLEPLQPNPNANAISVVRNLLTESNHPPLFFILNHWWLQLFPTVDGRVTATAARSLSAFFGALAVPASFALGQFAFRSRLIGHLSAVLMAVSPFGIYLAQEARHYTLPILWIMASLICLLKAAHAIRTRSPLPVSVCLTWILVNTLAIATHYLTILALGATALVAMTLGLVQSWREQGMWHPSAHWWRIVAVAVGTAVGGLIWLPFLRDIQDSKLTEWILQGDRSGLEWLTPLGQTIAGWISMLYMLPIQASAQLIVILSGALLILFTLWTVPKVIRGWFRQSKKPSLRFPLLVLGCYGVSAILIFLTITYLFDRDLTVAFRYNFVYFPAVIVLIAVGLAAVWDGEIARSQAPNFSAWKAFLLTGSKRTVITIVLLSLLGGITVIFNLGYQKTHRPDVMVQDILRQSQGNILVAIAHSTHGQTGRLMGIAWELEQYQPSTAPTLPRSTLTNSANPIQPHFLMARVEQGSSSIVRVIRKALRQLPRPLDVWFVNIREVPDKPLDILLDQQNCSAITKRKSTDGYRYRLYRCE